MTRHCSVPQCDKVHYCKGYCRTHYSRYKAHGTPDGGPRNHVSLEERFWGKVQRRGPDQCWPWIGKRQASGYGRIGIGANTQTGAHQVCFEMHNGYKPEVVMHTCDNPWCVNPAHLKAGTRKLNMQDCVAKGRFSHAPKTWGGKHHRAKLTEADVREIKSRPAAKGVALAKQFGVEVAVIYRIRAGTAWKHVV